MRQLRLEQRHKARSRRPDPPTNQRQSPRPDAQNRGDVGHLEINRAQSENEIELASGTAPSVINMANAKGWKFCGDEVTWMDH